MRTSATIVQQTAASLGGLYSLPVSLNSREGDYSRKSGSDSHAALTEVSQTLGAFNCICRIPVHVCTVSTGYVQARFTLGQLPTAGRVGVAGNVS